MIILFLKSLCPACPGEVARCVCARECVWGGGRRVGERERENENMNVMFGEVKQGRLGEAKS